MSKLLKRKEKIKLLQAIKEGKVSIECLQPPETYIFIERSNKPEVYEMNGKDYTETEYRKFCDEIRRKKSNSIIWNEGKEYLKKDTIITLVCARNCEPLKDNCPS